MRIGLLRWSALIEGPPWPALFTSTSILPKRLSTLATIASKASGCARSVGSASIVPDLSCTVAASAANPASLRSTAATSTPAPSSPSVNARPMPLAAPVTIAAFRSAAIGVSSVAAGSPGLRYWSRRGSRALFQDGEAGESTCVGSQQHRQDAPHVRLAWLFGELRLGREMRQGRGEHGFDPDGRRLKPRHR